MTSPDHVRPEGARRAAGEWPAGWSVWIVEETGSTNADLLALADDLPDRTVLVTDHQTAGRGRLDRRWDAPPGTSLMVSILFRAVPADPGELTRRVGLAAVVAAGQLGVADVVLKWPNDLLLGGAKLAGILAQRAPTGPVVVGLGLNIAWAPEGAAQLADRIDPPPERDDLLRALLVAYDRLPADVSEQYRSTLATIGMRVRVELPDGELTGTAIDVDPDGRLVVLDECAISHRVDVGDIVHVRPA